MSKFKRAFTILLCILLTLPMCLVSKPNNVYAATETKTLTCTWSPKNEVIAKDGYHEYDPGGSGRYIASNTICSNYLDLSDVLNLSITVTASAFMGGAKVQTIYLQDSLGNKYCSTDIGGNFPYLGANTYTKSVTSTLYLNEISDKSCLRICIVGEVYTCTSSQGAANSKVYFTSATAVVNGKPKFNTNSYVQSNGNLTQIENLMIFARKSL